MCSSVHLFICSSVHLFICSSVHLFIHSIHLDYPYTCSGALLKVISVVIREPALLSINTYSDRRKSFSIIMCSSTHSSFLHESTMYSVIDQSNGMITTNPPPQTHHHYLAPPPLPGTNPLPTSDTLHPPSTKGQISVDPQKLSPFYSSHRIHPITDDRCK
jgi:hypothetical protein